MKIELSLVDVAAHLRERLGMAVETLDFPVPEHDWRWHVEYETEAGTGSVTFGRSNTAEYVAEYFKGMGWEL